MPEIGASSVERRRGLLPQTGEVKMLIYADVVEEPLPCPAPASVDVAELPGPKVHRAVRCRENPVLDRGPIKARSKLRVISVLYVLLAFF